MEAIIVYSDNKDKELVELTNILTPIFMKYIDYNTIEGKKEAYKIKSHWSAKKNPFVVVKEGEKIIKVFYSEQNGNAIQDLINYLNDSKN